MNERVIKTILPKESKKAAIDQLDTTDDILPPQIYP